jgi:uncharacterized SAM-binding protein YcdF (DUF218 family)
MAPMARRLTRAMLILATLTILAGAAQFLYLAWRINWTGSHDQAQPADAIIVLGARVEPNGQPGPDLRARTLHAVGLFQRGLAPVVICTGGFEGDRLSAAAVARRLAIGQGIPTAQVFVADGSMTTSEDAASAAGLMQANAWRTAVLVSHPLHLERARLLFEGQGIRVYPSPTSTDLRAIAWRTRAWLTVREVAGIVWTGLEALGVPYAWTEPLSRYIYGPAHAPGAN